MCGIENARAIYDSETLEFFSSGKNDFSFCEACVRERLTNAKPKKKTRWKRIGFLPALRGAPVFLRWKVRPFCGLSNSSSSDCPWQITRNHKPKVYLIVHRNPQYFHSDREYSCASIRMFEEMSDLRYFMRVGTIFRVVSLGEKWFDHRDSPRTRIHWRRSIVTVLCQFSRTVRFVLFDTHFYVFFMLYLYKYIRSNTAGAGELI